MHDVFVSFLESSGKFRLTGSLRGYLATCVANKARNVNKAKRRHQSITLGNASQDNTSSNSPESSMIFGEELYQLSLAIKQLPYEQREVLILHSYSGMKFRTVARQQNVSINTVQGRYRYAIDKLRSMLNGEVKK